MATSRRSLFFAFWTASSSRMSVTLIVLTATSMEVAGVAGLMIIEHFQTSAKPPDDVGRSDCFLIDLDKSRRNASKATGCASCGPGVTGCSIATAPGARFSSMVSH
ncbi:hypothetical protein F4604DRAFT_1732205 [Suillus subluteus]|nr:hypothetical protein F4604DRAFT_1732205 [Suillus subluteus]